MRIQSAYSAYAHSSDWKLLNSGVRFRGLFDFGVCFNYCFGNGLPMKCCGYREWLMAGVVLAAGGIVPDMRACLFRMFLFAGIDGAALGRVSIFLSCWALKIAGMPEGSHLC